MPDWIGAFVQTGKVRVWEVSAHRVAMRDVQDPETFQDWARSAAVPIVACGLPVTARAVPSIPLTDVTRTGIAPNVAAIPGLSQAQPAWSSRGLETAIAGYLHNPPGFDGVLCLQAEENMWAQVSAGEVVSFQTFLTPQLQDALDGGTAVTAEFDAAVTDTVSHPERLARHLSSAKAQESPDRITGHLIGAELAAAKPYWLGQRVVILGDGPVLHTHALTGLGAMPEAGPLDDMMLDGLRLAYEQAITSTGHQLN